MVDKDLWCHMASLSHDESMCTVIYLLARASEIHAHWARRAEAEIFKWMNEWKKRLWAPNFALKSNMFSDTLLLKVPDLPPFDHVYSNLPGHCTRPAPPLWVDPVCGECGPPGRRASLENKTHDLCRISQKLCTSHCIYMSLISSTASLQNNKQQW